MPSRHMLPRKGYTAHMTVLAARWHSCIQTASTGIAADSNCPPPTASALSTTAGDIDTRDHIRKWLVAIMIRYADVVTVAQACTSCTPFVSNHFCFLAQQQLTVSLQQHQARPKGGVSHCERRVNATLLGSQHWQHSNTIARALLSSLC